MIHEKTALYYTLMFAALHLRASDFKTVNACLSSPELYAYMFLSCFSCSTLTCFFFSNPCPLKGLNVAVIQLDAMSAK